VVSSQLSQVVIPPTPEMKTAMLLGAVCALTPLVHALVIKGPLDSCGGVAKYDNAEPKNHADAMETAFNKDTNKREPVTFKKGDSVTFKCKAGFSVDGAKDGKTEFDAKCTDMGYFKPDGTCIEASKCGAVPTIDKATATPKIVKGAVQFACNPGYSLDGEKVVAGGMGANQLFTLKCVEFNNKYEAFKGECKPYAFVASKESTRIYNSVFEALFIVTCKGKLITHFGKGNTAGPFDATCSKLKAGSSECQTLVTSINAEFKSKQEALKKDKKDKEWFDTEGKPNIDGPAGKFCEDLYKIVEKPNP